MKIVGRVLRLTGRYEADEKICEQAMNLAMEHNYGDGIAFAHMEWGRLDRDLEKWEDSKRHWAAIIEWCENHKDEADLDISFLMTVIGELGWVEFHLGNALRGRDLVKRSLASLEGRGGKGVFMEWHWRLANIENALGNQEEALQHAQETFFWAKRLGRKRALEGAQALLEELHAEPKQPGESEDEESA